MRNCRGREKNGSFLHFMQDFFLFYFIITSALLHTFLHVQALVGVCHFREEVGFPLLCRSACHAVPPRVDSPQGVLMSLAYFVLFSLHHVADGLCQQKSWGRKERVFLKNTSKKLSLSFQSLHWAKKASGESEKKVKKINQYYLHKKQKGCFGFCLFVGGSLRVLVLFWFFLTRAGNSDKLAHTMHWCKLAWHQQVFHLQPWARLKVYACMSVRGGVCMLLYIHYWQHLPYY